mgnify:CR=1 FL=1
MLLGGNASAVWPQGVHDAALVLADELDWSQEVLERVRCMDDGGTAFQSLGVEGWLGAVAARRGDLETAHFAESTLAGTDRSQMGGWPAHYRSAIAAWLATRTTSGSGCSSIPS